MIVGIVALTLFHSSLSAATGDVDTAFGSSGTWVLTGASTGSTARAIAVLPDRKVIVVGRCDSTAESVSRACVARLAPNGVVDGSFGSGGFVETAADGYATYPDSVTVAPDGSTFVGATCSNISEACVLKYGPDGVLDARFGRLGILRVGGSESPGISRVLTNVLALQQDGKIILAGTCKTSALTTNFCVFRFLANGDSDGSFGQSGVADFKITAGADSARGVVVLPDGKILVGGLCFSDASTLPSKGMNFCVAKLLSDGHLDSDFGTTGFTLMPTTDGWLPNGVSPAYMMDSVRVDSYGAILVTSNCTPATNALSQFCVARFNADGKPDGSFGNRGIAFVEFSAHASTTGVELQADGNILLVGFCNGTACLARLQRGGALDLSFGSNGKAFGPTAGQVGLQGLDKFLVAGRCRNGTRFDMCVTRHDLGVVSIARKQMTEFRYVPLDYYFMTSRDNEKKLLDSSAGWVRTGANFSVLAAKDGNASGLIRFYFDKVARSQSRGSHFYTLIADEIQAVQSLNPSNQSAPGKPVNEGIDSFAYLPDIVGICPANTLPVYRLFRGNAMFPDDPNHRFTTALAVYSDFRDRGWTAEGVKLCAPSN